MVVCEEKKIVGGKREWIILLLFYKVVYIIYWVVCKNKNWDVGGVVNWVGKINKVVFEDAK